METQMRGTCPGAWGAEGFPEEMRLEPKPKDKYELSRPCLSVVSWKKVMTTWGRARDIIAGGQRHAFML